MRMYFCILLVQRQSEFLVMRMMRIALAGYPEYSSTITINWVNV